jgi:hypothetical protein
MGMITKANIEAWQKAAGIEPATGKRAKVLGKMSDAAFELIKIIELERSGIRDGDGYWHGSDAMGDVAQDLVSTIKAYERLADMEWGEAGMKIREEIGPPIDVEW